MNSCTCDFSFSYLDMTSFNISLCSSSLSAILWLNVTGAVFCAECATLKALPRREFNSSSWKADQKNFWRNELIRHRRCKVLLCKSRDNMDVYYMYTSASYNEPYALVWPAEREQIRCRQTGSNLIYRICIDTSFFFITYFDSCLRTLAKFALLLGQGN